MRKEQVFNNFMPGLDAAYFTGAESSVNERKQRMFLLISWSFDSAYARYGVLRRTLHKPNDEFGLRTGCPSRNHFSDRKAEFNRAPLLINSNGRLSADSFCY